jgi:hypothetical protein
MEIYGVGVVESHTKPVVRILVLYHDFGSMGHQQERLQTLNLVQPWVEVEQMFCAGIEGSLGISSTFEIQIVEKRRVHKLQ